MRAADLLCRDQTLVRVCRRHADVHAGDVRRVDGDETEQLVRPARLADDLQPALPTA
jgi:hypothetical protein